MTKTSGRMDTPDVPTLQQRLDACALQLYRCGVSLPESVREFRKLYLLNVLTDCDLNLCAAARVLGMHRNSLGRTLLQVGINMAALRAGSKPPRSVLLTARNVVQVRA